MSGPTIYTIGHSNRTFDAFLELLHGQGVKLLADVRRFPGSRAYPHFNSEVLSVGLANAGIEYQHYPGLGGRRGKPLRDSVNTGWRVEAFNAYADYMATREFQKSLDELISAAKSKTAAIMCAEAVPWRCHRRLIADALTVRGWTVLDIVSPSAPKPHSLTPFARVKNQEITYPGGTLFD